MNKIIRTWGGIVGIGCCQLAFAQVVVLQDARATYLRVNNDAALDAPAIALTSLGVAPGNVLQMEVVGDFSRQGTGGVRIDKTTAVFSSSAVLLSGTNLNRVQGAIDAGTDIATLNTWQGGLSTDIAQDFEVNPNAVPERILQIPAGSTHIFFSPFDDFFEDNVSFGYGVRFTKAVSKSIKGTCNLQEYIDPINTFVTVEIIKRGVVVESQMTPLTVGGNYTIFTLHTGPGYSVRAKGSHWLAQRIDNVTLSSGMVTLNFDLVNGDIDRDNAVTIFDYVELSTSFDKGIGENGFNANADLDGDGFVSIFDYLILSNSFDHVGDELS
ncbi:MAG: hypothetical protein JST40_10945 [Armatimonadetes bacterium]|nr:hypothetical protein [Armatimonadota bacterium]